MFVCASFAKQNSVSKALPCDLVSAEAERGSAANENQQAPTQSIGVCPHQESNREFHQMKIPRKNVVKIPSIASRFSDKFPCTHIEILDQNAKFLLECIISL